MLTEIAVLAAFDIDLIISCWADCSDEPPELYRMRQSKEFTSRYYLESQPDIRAQTGRMSSGILRTALRRTLHMRRLIRIDGQLLWEFSG